MLRRLRGFPWYLVLFAISPTLMLLGHNISDVDARASSRALTLSLIIAALLFLIFLGLSRNLHRASLAASLSLIIFYTYGHVYQLLRNWNAPDVALGRHRYLLPLAFALLSLGVWFALKIIKEPDSLAVPLNLIALAMLLTPAIQILSHEVGHRSARAVVSRAAAETPPVQLSMGDALFSETGPPPDIYYIILDAYGREDVLEEYFGIDNSEFLDSLRAMGFWIADCSHSNYAITTLSLASSLNMSYIDDMFQGPVEPRLLALEQMAQNNLVRRTLKDLGYQVVSFESGYFVTEWADADFYFKLDAATGWKLRGLNSFEALLVDTTMLRVLRDWEGDLPFGVPYFLNYAYYQHRRHILNVLDHLPQVAEIPGPTFTMAHVLAPHDPFVFGPHGENVTQHETFTLKPDILREDKPEYTRGYADQLEYVNSRVLQVVKSILENSSQAPIIIIQGDHGPKRNMSSDFARMANLNAYLLPQGGSADLYSTITPVNTFRVILDRYFGADLPLLPDVSYLSKVSDRFDFKEILEAHPACRTLRRD